MYKKLNFFICLVILVFACNKAEEQAPVPREKMVSVLVDVHVAESALQEMATSNRDSIGQLYYNKIFTLHQISEADFNKSLFLFKKDPEKLESLYKDVLKELEKREQEGRQ